MLPQQQCTAAPAHLGLHQSICKRTAPLNGGCNAGRCRSRAASDLAPAVSGAEPVSCKFSVPARVRASTLVCVCATVQRTAQTAQCRRHSADALYRLHRTVSTVLLISTDSTSQTAVCTVHVHSTRKIAVAVHLDDFFVQSRCFFRAGGATCRRCGRCTVSTANIRALRMLVARESVFVSLPTCISTARRFSQCAPVPCNARLYKQSAHC